MRRRARGALVGSHPAVPQRLSLAVWLVVALPLSCVNELGGAVCEVDTDCRAQQFCDDGACRTASTQASCVVDTDCDGGETCLDGLCLLPPSGGDDGGPGGDDGPDRGTVAVTPEGILDFGSPVLGVGIVRTLSVSNLGGGSFEIVGLERAAGTSDEFAWHSDRPLPVRLGPDERMEVEIIYTLADGTDDIGTLYLETTATECEPSCASPAAIPIEVVSEFKGSRNLVVSPEEHDFGYVQPAEQSAARSLLLTNEGSLEKVLTVSSIEVSGDQDAFDFALPPLPLYLAPGQSADIPVVYVPTVAASLHEVSFIVEANSDALTQRTGTAVFRGTSQPPNALIFDPPEIVFPELVVGQTAQRESVLKNIGGTAVKVTSLVLASQSPVEYAAATAVQLPYTLLPGASITVYVDFAAVSGVESSNRVEARNDQPSGQVPVLALRGAGYVPPGGPNLEVVAGPDKDPLPGCLLQAEENVPAANVDLSYRSLSSGAVCSKPADLACGINGGSCNCPALASYGDVTWAGSRVETVRGGEIWIVDEKVSHTGSGQDGTFAVRTDLIDDCVARPRSNSYDLNYNLCLFDCDYGGPQACFDYYQYPYCSAACQYFATTTVSQDCLRRGPAPVRTTIRIWGAASDVTRHFCTTLQQSGSYANVATLKRENGYFTIESVASGVVEVTASQPCPG